MKAKDLAQFSRGDPIELVWYDILSVPEWVSFEKVKDHKISLVRTRGFFLETAIHFDIPILYVAGSISEEEAGNTDIIPMALIASIK